MRRGMGVETLRRRWPLARPPPRPSGSRACRWGCARSRGDPDEAPSGACSGPGGRRRRPAGRRRRASASGRSCTTATTSWPHRSLGRPDHDGVEHGRVALEGLLDLLGEHLLAAGVDGDRVAAVQLDGAVGQHAGPVAGHGVADAVDGREGAGRLVGIAEVAERHPPGLGQPAELVVAGLEDAGCRSSDSTTLVGERSKRAGAWRRCARSEVLHALAAVSEEPSTSTMRRPGHQLEQLLLHRGRQRPRRR